MRFPFLRLPVLAACAAAVLLAPAAAGAADHVVYAGPPEPQAKTIRKAVEVVGFYPGHVAIHEGDTITWKFTGALHMVTVPTTDGTRPLFGWVLFDRPLLGYTDAAGKPLWWDGQPTQYVPEQAAERDNAAPFDGTSVRNSGIPHPPAKTSKPYRLQFSKQGIYTVLCIVHPTMHMTVTVVPKSQPLQPASYDREAAQQEIKRTLKLAARLDHVAKPPNGTVYAGYDAGDVSLLKFFPAVTTVKAGGSVDFVLKSVKESHAIVFGPWAFRKKLGENIIQFVPRPGMPDLLIFNPYIFIPSDPESAFPAYDGTNHGDGYLNTGALDLDPLTPYDDHQVVKFTKPGDFVYECPIHPGMTGKIHVVA